MISGGARVQGQLVLLIGLGLAVVGCPLPETIAPEIYCGNGVVEAEEVCDDGNSEDTDDCLSTCVLASCGDGFIHAEDEVCDDGNSVDTDDCLSTCLAASCGDGFVHEDNEACDDGNSVDTDDCLSTCVAASCGDGFVHAQNEACDDGNESETDACLSDCSAASCGDGFVHEGVEQCDDSNTDSTDECTENCQEANCGDGFVWADEEACDDGNRDDTDDCSNTCEDQSHLVNGFDGREGPIIGDGWRQCAGYLDYRDREDIPQDWGRSCTQPGMEKVRLYCGSSPLRNKFIELDRNVFREGLGPGINEGDPARGLITRSSWGAGDQINVQNLVWADGQPSHPHAGMSHWGSNGTTCSYRIQRRLIVNGPGCSYEAADCFGQNIGERYLWVYVKP